MPRPPSTCGSDGRESYWVDGYGPDAAPARSLPAYSEDDELSPRPRHRGGVTVEGPGEQHYTYIPYRDAGNGTGGGYGKRENRPAPPPTSWSYLGRDGREYFSYEDLVAANERWRAKKHERSKKGGDWLLLAAAVTVAATVYLFGTAETKKAKERREQRHGRARSDSSHGSETELGSYKSRSRSRSRSGSLKRRASALG